MSTLSQLIKKINKGKFNIFGSPLIHKKHKLYSPNLTAFEKQEINQILSSLFNHYLLDVMKVTNVKVRKAVLAMEHPVIHDRKLDLPTYTNKHIIAPLSKRPLFKQWAGRTDLHVLEGIKVSKLLQLELPFSDHPIFHAANEDVTDTLDDNEDEVIVIETDPNPNPEEEEDIKDPVVPNPGGHNEGGGQKFTIKGRVIDQTKKVSQNTELYAFDVDLKGIGKLKDLKSFKALHADSGFEYLEKASTNKRGEYEVSFYDSQYQRRERGKADVIIVAVSNDQIIGRSRMVNVTDYDKTGLVKNLNLFVNTGDHRNEYQKLEETIVPYLKENDCDPRDLAEATEELVFVAGELEIAQSKLLLFSQADKMEAESDGKLSRELLYGVGRQKILLTPLSLYKRKNQELLNAVGQSMVSGAIGTVKAKQAKTFLTELKDYVTTALLERDKGDDSGLDAILSNSLESSEQKKSFLNAVKSFNGTSASEFWSQHLPSQGEFKKNPQLVQNLLTNQRLTALTASHQPLIKELSQQLKNGDVKELMSLNRNQWNELIDKTGTPQFIKGSSDYEKKENYVKFMEDSLNAAFPTKRMAINMKTSGIPNVSKSASAKVLSFLDQTPEFDFVSSRVLDFKDQIQTIGGNVAPEVEGALTQMERLFQVTSDVNAIPLLMEHKFNSAKSIADIPQKAFIANYAISLGGNQAALAIHERAAYVSTKIELAANNLKDHLEIMPEGILQKDGRDELIEVFNDNIPNWEELFGSPDMCECEHCRSIYSPSAYFVELLRFLSRSEKNANGDSALDVLLKRRPDLAHLNLTCENSHTVIPYIDLVNEVLEFYTINGGSLENFDGYNTGDATPEELRANPQNTNVSAYKTLSNQVFPFTLPYHQPLDTIRTYADHVKTSKGKLMELTRTDSSLAANRKIAAEKLNMSMKDFESITKKKFNGSNVTTKVHSYYGYSSAAGLKDLPQVREFMSRSGLAYTEVIQLIETDFVNPYKRHVDFIEQVFKYVGLDWPNLYKILGALVSDSISGPDLLFVNLAIEKFNESTGQTLTFNEFAEWTKIHFEEFQQIILLYEPESKCSLDTTSLKTLQNVYEENKLSGISDDVWSRMHRFIRLRNKLGWSIEQTDVLLSGLGAEQILPVTIVKIAGVKEIQEKTKLSLEQLMTLWGDINTKGEKSLYAKLFLNKAALAINDVFKSNEWGEYLPNGSGTLSDALDSILAAFRITEDEFNAILTITQVRKSGDSKTIELGDDLSLHALSSIYRVVTLAKSLGYKIADFVDVISVLTESPFSIYNEAIREYEQVAPQDSIIVIRLLEQIKGSSFSAEQYMYALKGEIRADSKVAVSSSSVHEAITELDSAFEVIENEHPSTPENLTTEALKDKLNVTYSSEVTDELLALLEGTISQEAVIAANIAFSESDLEKIENSRLVYIKASGRLISEGIMTDDEKTELLGLSGTSAEFQTAINVFYDYPNVFIADHFGEILPDALSYDKTLLGRVSGMETPATLDEKLLTVHEAFLPLLKQKLRGNILAQHVGSVISLDEDRTNVLLKDRAAELITYSSEKGFTGSYYSDESFGALQGTTLDQEINFDWGTTAPMIGLPNDSFSVKWEGYIAPSSTDTFTFQVNVNGADDSFKLYVDEQLVLEKIESEAQLSWDVLVELNSSQLHQLKLEYIDRSNEASIDLKWKTATSELAVVPSSAVYSKSSVEGFTEAIELLNKAAVSVNAFDLNTSEITYFQDHAADFADLDFEGLNIDSWQKLNTYKEVVDAISQNNVFLTDVLASASFSPEASIEEIKANLITATGWDETSLAYLIDTHFNLSTSDFKGIDSVYKLKQILALVQTTGITASSLCQIGKLETGFDELAASAEVLKNAVRAKYSDKIWMDLASDLNDKLRGNQKNALIAHVLQYPSIKAEGITDGNGLFEYFLIDVEMSACMDTSRIVQANAAVQQFVARCRLNLESDNSSGSEKGISPTAIDAERWSWMKNYRVWEANRKVFVTPENWLEPEWRTDRSQFFKELESHFLQNDITDRSVEEGFRNYLYSVNEVANLEVCGTYRETHDDSDNLKYLHVFGRTNNAPYKYFYRTWNEYGKWSPWESVSSDIQSVEAGSDSGVALIPVVWKNRLFLFWPEYTEKARPMGSSNKSFEDIAGDNISAREPEKYWEVKLAWSEYIDGKWTGKQLTNRCLGLEEDGRMQKNASYSTEIDSKQKLHISLWVDSKKWYQGKFTFSDIQSPVKTSTTAMVPWTELEVSLVEFDYGFISGSYSTLEEVILSTTSETGYNSAFQKRSKRSRLSFDNRDYLKSWYDHTILGPNNEVNIDKDPSKPFFYSAEDKTYFVRPKKISLINVIVSPDRYPPIVPPTDPSPEPPIYNPPIGGPLEPIPDPRDPFIGFPLPPFETDPGFIFDFDTDLVVELGDFNYLEDQITTLTPSGDVFAFSDNPEGVRPMMRAVSMAAPQEGLAFQREDMYAVIPGVATVDDGLFFDLLPLYTIDGFEFHTFYHPYSSKYVQHLNQAGISKGAKGDEYPDGLMESDTSLEDDQGDHFEKTYQPEFTDGLIQKPSDFSNSKRTYYKENVCFDPLGANSIYNWELFFHAPLYMATRLSKNGKYEEAMKWFHYIFDPTTDAGNAPGESETAKFWQVLPFKTEMAQSMREWFEENLEPNSDSNSEHNMISEWRDNPFDPHKVASNRPLAYMKHVIIKYVENLVDWGDSLFRQMTRESVNEAIQVYVIANHILGKRPEFVPKRGEIKAETYATLESKLDDFSNALVQLENIFPYASDVNVSSSDPGTNYLGMGSAYYFCIPSNEKLITYWDTVDDRLYKIRHCLDINGVESKLALFAPAIDPAALINAASQGLSLGSILGDLNSPSPKYRFTYLVQKANEFCSDVKALGGSLLSALEKKDAESLSLMRASQETIMQELISSVRERNVLEAKASKESLEMARVTAKKRLQHYTDLLGNDALTIPIAPSVSGELNADSALPSTTNISEVETDVDTSLVDSGEAGVKLIPKEQQELNKASAAKWSKAAAGISHGLSAILNLIPQIDGEGTPMGVGVGAWYGGQNLGPATKALGDVLNITAELFNAEAAEASKMASYIRRDQDWTFQTNMAARQIIEIDKQLVAADIRIQIAEKELEIHEKSIEQAKEVELFVKDKFTNEELYQWMKEQLYSVYKQAYNLAFDMAKKTELSYQLEIGTPVTNFVQYGNWDDSKQGLLSGEKLQLSLRQMEKSYIEENCRELELTKHVSVLRLDPLALLELKNTGKCFVNIPEELFDLDYQGHYFRRLKSVSLSIPCITGPLTTVNCTLRLMSNSYRSNTALSESGAYEHNNDEGIFIDDSRFRSNNVPVTAIATSSGQNDSGMFEFNFRDERYLPFERAGAISEWQLELTTEAELRQFDYDSISDIIMHLNYTARESGGTFKTSAENYMKDYVMNTAALSNQPFKQMFSLKHEFSTAWHKFLYPANDGDDQELSLEFTNDYYPFFASDKTLKVNQIDVFIQSIYGGEYQVVLEALDISDSTVILKTDELTAPELSTYGNLKVATLEGAASGLNVDDIDAKNTINLKIRKNLGGLPDYTALETEPKEELENVFMVVHYSL